MFGGVSAPFIHRPVATTLLMVAILLVGLVAYPNLAVASLPQVDFPTITVAASLPGSPGNDGRLRRAAARTANRADSRRHANDVNEIRWAPPRSPSNSISTATSTPPPMTFRRQSTHRRTIAKRLAKSADLPQGQPVRHPNPHSFGAIGRRADHRRRRCGREHPGPAHQPNLWSVSSACRGPADAGHSHPDRSSQAAVEKGLQLEDVRQPDRHRDRRQSQRRTPSARNRRSRSTTTTS